MSNEDDVKLDETKETTTPETKPATKTDDDMIQKLVQDRIDEQLKDIKTKLDTAFSQRDELKSKLELLEKEKRDRELKDLQEAGKHKEAYEMQLAEEREIRKRLEQRNVELTRDNEVRQALGALPFRNDKAIEMANQEIVAQLVQNESGVWVHRSGVSVKDFVAAFANNEDNAFLFKQKTSSGAGLPSTSTTTSSTTKKSLFDMSQDEVLKLASEGKLR